MSGEEGKPTSLVGVRFVCQVNSAQSNCRSGTSGSKVQISENKINKQKNITKKITVYPIEWLVELVIFFMRIYISPVQGASDNTGFITSIVHR